MRPVTTNAVPGAGRAVAAGLDAVGAALWLGLIAWVVVVARTPQDATPVRDLLLAMAAVYTLARLVTRLSGWLVPVMVLVPGTVAAVWAIGGQLSGSGADPLGYANATGALALAAAAGGLVVVARLRGPEARSAAACASAACALAPWLADAITSALLALVLPVALMTRDLGMRVRGVIVWSAVASVAVVGCTAAVGVTFDGRGPVDWMVIETLSANRAILWGEAVEMLDAHPPTGVGTNRFSVASATARANPDLRWAHNEYLQLGAETGAPGLALALALLLWVFARLWFGPRDAGTAVVAAGVAVLSVAASIDYVWHFPAVALATAALAGSGRGSIRGAAPVVAVAGDREPRVHAAFAGDAVGSQQPEQRHR